MFLSYWYEKQLTIIWQHKSPIKISFSIYNWLWYLHIFYLVSSCSEWWFLTYFSPDARIRIQESWYFLFLVKNGSFNLVNLRKFILFRGIIFNVIIMKMTPLLPILNHKMLFHHFSTDCRQNQIKMLFLHIYCNSVLGFNNSWIKINDVILIILANANSLVNK